ncbi:pleckstrin homology domain-containing family A member 5 isoform X4 [Pangasianodon hypophthalmus]|uniref:pleckstrin homology domain-containing family A member 5 isoform X4 n=1 Tax=Pangasianodon hypophthalmus TaxID=310915 RepID=UPI002307D866|nr:pleckstrin homology domain-containing family A member 5 isoform X4 [Pangasianodon hypophthalmus]
MAADLNPDWLSCLPSSWSYGVIQDGRVFFINEEAKSTTWLHPVTGEAVITGHRKTPDLPTGWEEGYTFEGARCFINHNERKVTCKHPVSGAPSQDNCIFVVNEQPAAKAPATEKKERPTSIMSEASNYTGGSDYMTHPSSPTTRQSRSSKKVHNFGKRSHSIKRNPNAPVVKRSWLYKQDSTGMKMWKKRWFVLSDMCLFYYKDEKEEGILGSILLPSFHISLLSVDDHISKKYAFKATHPNMRTYYFCTDTAKEMESWIKVMTDATLVHTEPIKRLENVKVDSRSPLEMNNMLNHWVLTQPEIQNNERNRESLHLEDKKQKQLEKQPRIHREKERCAVQKDSEKYQVQKEGEKFALEKDGQKYPLQKSGYRYMLQKDVETFGVQKDGEKYASTLQKDSKRHALQRDEEINLLQKEMQRYTLHKDSDKHVLPKDNEIHSVHKDGEKYLQKDGGRPTQKTTVQKEAERSRLQREDEKYSLQKDGNVEQPLSKVDSVKLQPVQAATDVTAVSPSWQLQSRGGSAQYKATQVNGSGGEQSPGEMGNSIPQRTAVQPQQPAEPERSLSRSNSIQLEQYFRTHRTKVQDDDTKSITSYQTLPRNMPSHRTQVVPRYPEGYRTLPRNMLRPDSICSVAGSVYDCALQPVAAEKRRSMRDDTLWQLYEWQQRQAYSRMGYSTLPSPKTLSHIAESIPSSPSHGSLALYHSVSPNRPYNPSTMSEVSSPVFRGDVSIDRRHRAHRAKYAYPPDCRVPAAQSITPQSLQGKTTEASELPAHPLSDWLLETNGGRKSPLSTPSPYQTGLTPKPEELTLLLIKLRRQQAELNSIREQTLTQLMQLNVDAANPKNKVLSHHLQRNLMYLDSQMKQNEPIIFMIHTMIESSAPRPQLYQQMSPEAYSESIYGYRPEELDVDTKLSRLCEQGKVVRTQEEKLQQLHREKHTLETALLSASQELEMSADNPVAVQSLMQQRDVLQSGLLSSCRELSRVSTELDRSWKEYDKLEADVSLAKRNLLDQLEVLGSPQTEPPSQQHVQIQKELWRIQDVMDALNKNKPKRNAEPSFPPSGLQKKEESDSVPPRPPLPHLYEGRGRLCVPHLPSPSQLHPPRTGPHQPEDRKAAQRNGSHSGPDYRLYKSEPELTTVAEVDESNGEDKSDQAAEKEPSSTKVSYPVGVVSSRTKSPMPVSSTIASYVTLRKAKKPEPKTNRPNSTVEHISSSVEGVRQRMSVEEQMERIRRHQQGALRERRREDGSLSRSLSFTKDTPYYYTLQMSTKRREMSGGDSNQIRATTFKENCKAMEQELGKVSGSEFGEKVSVASRSPEQGKPLGTEDSLQTAVMVRVDTEENDDDEDLSGQSQDRIIKDSYNLTSSKHSTTASASIATNIPKH